MANNTFDILKRVIRDKGFPTLVELAAHLNKNPSTFFNGLQYFARTQNYGTKFASELLGALNMTAEELKQKIENTSNTRDTKYLKIIDQMSDSFKLSVHANRESINRLIDTLEAGDEVILCTFARPSEFDSVSRKNAVLNAIQKGVQFTYIYPDPTSKIIPHISDNYATGYANWETLAEHHEKFVDDIARKFEPADESIKNIYDGLSENDKRAICEKLLEAYYKDDPMLFNPLHSYISIHIKHEDHIVQLVFESSIVGSSAGLEDDYAVYWYPLPISLGYKIIEQLKLVTGLLSTNSKISRKAETTFKNLIGLPAR